jgi:hypothetical protein
MPGPACAITREMLLSPRAFTVWTMNSVGVLMRPR